MIHPIHTIRTMPEVNADSSVGLLVKARPGDNDGPNRFLARYLPGLRRSASRRLPLGLQPMLDTGDLVGQRGNSYPPQKTQRQCRVGRRIPGDRTAGPQDGRRTLMRLGW